MSNAQYLMGQWNNIVGAAWQQIVGQGAPAAAPPAQFAPGPTHGGARHHHGLQPWGGNWAYPFPPRAALVPAPAPTSADRQVLPMNTGTTPVPIGLTAQITSRPQRVAFRPERVFVSAADVGGGGSAANWIINDITIGNRSQFAQSGALPGDMFGQQAIDTYVTFETAQTAMDVVMIVTYQGATEGGTPFYGSIVGTAAV
jgi:hypothetical protein